MDNQHSLEHMSYTSQISPNIWKYNRENQVKISTLEISSIDFQIHGNFVDEESLHSLDQEKRIDQRWHGTEIDSKGIFKVIFNNVEHMDKTF